MPRSLIAHVAAALLLAGIGPSAASARDAYTNRELPRLFADQTSLTPGASIAILRDGSVTYAAGFGSADLAHRVLIDANTRFDVGSIAKQFTAFAIYQLASVGQVSTSRSVRAYLPELPATMSRVTIQELLWQTSGIRDYIDLAAMDGHELTDSITLSDLFSLMRFQRTLQFDPGTRHNYSNTNYALLAEIVARVTHEPFSAYVSRNIFTPLRMTHSLFRDDSGAVIPDLADSYWPTAGGTFTGANGRSDIVGDSNLITTPSDLLLWEDNLMSRRFGAKAIERLEAQGLLTDGSPTRSGMGSGLELSKYDGTDALRFDGGSEGFRADVIAFPDRHLAIAIFTNLITFFPEDQLDTISDHYLGMKPSSPAPSLAQPTPRSAPTLNLQTFVGTYRSEALDTTYWICREGNSLVARHVFGPEVALTPVDKDAFAGSFWWFQNITFERNRDDSIGGMNVSSFRGALDVEFKKTDGTCDLN